MFFSSFPGRPGVGRGARRGNPFYVLILVASVPAVVRQWPGQAFQLLFFSGHGPTILKEHVCCVLDFWRGRDWDGARGVNIAVRLRTCGFGAGGASPMAVRAELSQK